MGAGASSLRFTLSTPTQIINPFNLDETGDAEVNKSLVVKTNALFNEI